MIDISELLDDIEVDNFSFHAPGERVCEGMFINFEGRMVLLDDNLPEGIL